MIIVIIIIIIIIIIVIIITISDVTNLKVSISPWPIKDLVGWLFWV